MAKAKKVDKKAASKKTSAKAPAKKSVKAEKPKKEAKAAKPSKKVEKKEAPKKVAKKAPEKPAKKAEPTKKASAKPVKAEKSKKVEKPKAAKAAQVKSADKSVDKKGAKDSKKESKVTAKPGKKSESKSTPAKVVEPDLDDAFETEDDEVIEPKGNKKTASKSAKKPSREEIDLPEMDDDFGGDDDFGDFEEVEAPAKKTKAVERDDKDEVSSEIILTDAEGRRLCKVPNCDQVSTVEGYCRYHYLLFWKRIQVRKKILSEGKLEKYIEELTSRYPMKYLEMLKKDLRSHQDFLSAIQELEIDDSSSENEFEDEAQNFIDEVRGISGTEGESDDEY